MRKLILIIVVACTVAACNDRAPFEAYKKKFTEKKLPIAIKGCYLSDSNFVVLEPARDTPVRTDKVLGYCTFAPNGKYFVAITLSPADCYVPDLYTYSEDGKLIDHKSIDIGGCGADCCFTCEEYMVINADYTIYTSDTVSECRCDTAGNEIPGTMQHYVRYKKGRLLENGKIELSDEKKLVLGNSSMAK